MTRTPQLVVDQCTTRWLPISTILSCVVGCSGLDRETLPSTVGGGGSEGTTTGTSGGAQLAGGSGGSTPPASGDRAFGGRTISGGFTSSSVGTARAGEKAAGGDGATGNDGPSTIGGGNGGNPSGETPPPTVDKPSTDSTWSQGLAAGPNGPIPLIVVDQFGYRTTSPKFAVIRDPQTGYDSAVNFTPGTRYTVVNNATGATVKEGAPAEWNGGATDTSSGDKVWWFDFSDITTPGMYAVVDVDKNVRSVEFEINDDVYRSVLKHAVRMFHYQRAGFAKPAAAVGSDWADGASHLGAGQDSQARAWLAKGDASQVRDLHGGWYDAGDSNRYTAWAAGTAITLLHAYIENPSAFADDYGIAESGNGIPDLLDEVKYAVDWIARMQTTDGSLLCILGSGGGSPPSQTTELSYYGPATTNATLAGAAVFAMASKVYGARPEASLKAFAADLKSRAAKAWTWSEANPSVIYHNNDDSKQPGSGGLGAGNQEVDDNGRLLSKFQAAAHLYDLTGEETYKTFAESNWTRVLAADGPTEWDMEKADAVVYFAQLSGVTSSVSSAIVYQVTANVGNQLASTAGSNKDPYRAFLTHYTWSSNQIKMAQARLFQHLAKHSAANSGKASAAAEDYVHYLHGVNPLGLVYLTNMKRAGAERSAKTVFHFWFADKSPKWDETTATTPGPAPGFLSGGPNTGFAPDSCCTAPAGDAAYRCHGSADFALCNQNWNPPMGQPQQKSYLEYNGGWPVGSWSITEPSTGYQAKYVLVVSALARTGFLDDATDEGS
jgi:endoglucanase